MKVVVRKNQETIAVVDAATATQLGNDNTVPQDVLTEIQTDFTFGRKSGNYKGYFWDTMSSE